MRWGREQRDLSHKVTFEQRLEEDRRALRGTWPGVPAEGAVTP